MATILLDMDDTILDLKGPWLARYNELKGTDIKMSAWVGWDANAIGEGMYDILKEDGFFASLPPYEEAIEVIRRLNEKHEVVLLTASVFGPSMKDKGLWVQKHLPFIPEDNFMIARKKYLVRGDVLVDDGPHNISAFPGLTIAKRHGHNTNSNPDFWYDSMPELEMIINDLYGGYKVLG